MSNPPEPSHKSVGAAFKEYVHALRGMFANPNHVGAGAKPLSKAITDLDNATGGHMQAAKKIQELGPMVDCKDIDSQYQLPAKICENARKAKDGLKKLESPTKR